MVHKDEQIEILVEEPSMKNFLETKLPDFLPEGYGLGINVFIRSHNGKSDLMRSIPKKIQAFSHYYRPVKIIIVHDQDSHDCRELKQKILELCAQHGDCPVLVRIACRELENWYLGNLYAVEAAYPGFKAAKHINKKKFRDPDHCHGADEMEKLLPNFQKGQAAREIPPHIDLDQNRSPSFGHLVSGLKLFLSE